MRIHALAIPILAAACVSLAACSGGKSNGTTPSTGTPTPAKTASIEAFKAAAERAANSTLLTIVDFSKGWQGTAQHHSDLDVPLSSGCNDFFNQRANYAGSIFENESDEFSAKNEESVSSDVGIYRTTELAEQAQTQFTDMFARCRGEMETAFKQYFTDQGIDAPTVSFTDIPSPARGDWTHAFKFSLALHGPGGSIQSDTYINLVRTGRVEASLSYTDDGTFDHQMGDRLVTTLSDRVAAAEAALPE